MNNELTIFDNPEFGKIRTINIDGEPWFVGKDVAEALGYSNTKDALARHVDEEDKQRGSQIPTPSGTQTATIINESGLYSLIFSSRLPKAKEFKRWVTSEVLPSIRRTGSYSLSDAQPVEPVTAKDLGSISRFIGLQRRIMKDRNCTADEVAIMSASVCKQFGVNMPDCLTKPHPFRQIAWSSEVIDI